jgi:hypothetical protein
MRGSKINFAFIKRINIVRHKVNFDFPKHDCVIIEFAKFHPNLDTPVKFKL